jgi:hypothetical protein
MKSLQTKLLAVAGAALLAVALAAPVAQAATPAPGYTQFKGCPSQAEIAAVESCTRSVITGGHFKMGSKTVPIEKPLTLTGGRLPNGDIVANAEGGLPPVKQKVPGGVIGLTGLTWLLEFFGSEALTLYAVTEVVGIPNLDESLKLPIRVHLINPLLGSKCYVGSPSNPIVLNMITGTTAPPPPNKPITGREADFSFHEASEIITLKNGIFVDNSFSAPGASGCTLTLFGFIPISINGLVNSQSGLPSPAGKNETVQNWEAELANQDKVYP